MPGLIGSADSACQLEDPAGFLLHQPGDRFKAWIITLTGEQLMGIDHAKTGDAVFGVDRNPAGLASAQAEINPKNCAGMKRLADLIDPAFLSKGNSLAAQGFADVVVSQHAIALGFASLFKVLASLVKGFGRGGDAEGGGHGGGAVDTFC